MGEYKPEEGNFNVGAVRIAIIAARWNSEVTDGLLAGAVRALSRHGVSDDAIEKILSLGAQQAPAVGQFAGKISGSGLGDCVLLLGTTGISDWAETQMALKLEPQGVRAETCLPNLHNR